MRQIASVPALRTLVILLALGALGGPGLGGRAHADNRSDARAHYQAGVKHYASGDYRGAIREFSAAQQLAPADLNNYNLALCYDKLGDAEPAIQYYRAFLDKQPNTDKRTEIEASINRLEAASRSAANKKADEARRADEARKADDAKRAEEARAEEARRPQGPIGPAAGPSAPPSGSAGPAPGPIGPAPAPPADERKPPAKGPAIAGSIGPPSTGSPVPTGDSELDRINSINIDEIRDQRAGARQLPDGRSGSPVASAGAPQPGPAGRSGPAPSAPTEPVGAPGGDAPKKEKPVYKKWWFWVVMGVSGVVLYNLATSESSASSRARDIPQGGTASPPGGLPLLRW